MRGVLLTAPVLHVTAELLELKSHCSTSTTLFPKYTVLMGVAFSVFRARCCTQGQF